VILLLVCMTVCNRLPADLSLSQIFMNNQLNHLLVHVLFILHQMQRFEPSLVTNLQTFVTVSRFQAVDGWPTSWIIKKVLISLSESLLCA